MHPVQFKNVANGTIFAGMISGTYDQTNGPVVKPKIMKNMQKRTMINVIAGLQLLNKKSTPSKTSIVPNPQLPIRIRGRLPHFDRAKTAVKVAKF